MSEFKVEINSAKEAEERLKLYALTCAALNAAYKTFDTESDEAFNIQQAFSDIWDEALAITDHRDFYSRIEGAKKVIDFWGQEP